MLINQSTMQGCYRTFNTIFKDALAQALAKSMWDKIAMRVGSTGESVEYDWLGAFPMMREWIGERAVKDVEEYGFVIRNRDFEATVGVGRNKIEDDQLGVYTPQFQNLGDAAARHRDQLVFALLAAGFTTPCYDKQYFFDTDHPVGDGVVSNFGGGAGTPWFLMDLSWPIKPILLQVRKEPEFVAMDKPTDENVFMRKTFYYGVDDRKNVGFGLWQMAHGSKQTLDATNYEAARVALGGVTDDVGNKLGMRGTHLVVPQSYEGAGRALLNNERLANGATNTWFGTAELVVVPWL
jgi:phage major head subunit gpT-like protein